jgi:hypothetical protein
VSNNYFLKKTNLNETKFSSLFLSLLLLLLLLLFIALVPILMNYAVCNGRRNRNVARLSVGRSVPCSFNMKFQYSYYVLLIYSRV